MEAILPGLAAALLAGVLFLLLWHRRRDARRQAAIAAFPLERLLDRRLARRRPEFSAAQRRQVFAALRDYFQLCRVAGRRMVAMPSQAADDAWHEFILFTREYRRFCRAAFGRYLHHTPAEAMSKPTQASDGLRRAWRLACQRAGIDPRAPAALPALFALDAELGIPDGFRYRLDCLAAGQAGSGYCASHLGGGDGDTDGADGDGGDGGGCGGD